jgi:hypothetical protein
VKKEENPMRTKATQTLKRTITAVSLAAGLFMVQVPSASALAQECTVNWDDPSALGYIYDQARLGFVVPTTFDNQLCTPSGNSAQTNLRCWQYRQDCGTSRISVWDQYYDEWHLPFEDPSIGQCVINNGFGRMIGGRCVAPDWVHEPRYAVSHEGDAWWEILLLGPSHDLKTFDLKTISVGGTTPIQMWFRKVDGSVWGWDQLPAGVNWDVSGSASSIVAVWISAVTGNLSPFTINGFSIRAH